MYYYAVPTLAAEIGSVVWGTQQISTGFASCLRYCTTFEQWAPAKLCGLEQRAPAIFGRTAITLGIGPHSSLLVILWCNAIIMTAPWSAAISQTRTSSGDEIANVNFFAMTSSTTFMRCVREATEFGEITQNKGHYAVQGHSRSPILVPIERLCTTSY